MTIIDDLYRGSNTDKNKFYHQNYFGDELYQRQDSIKRLKKMINHYDFRNKNILDLGCNIGFFSFGVSEKADKVIGIDYDKNAIDFANKMKEENNVNNITFINEKITLQELEKIGKVDCTFGLAVHSWIIHESSRDEMEKILEWQSKNSKVSFIELQYNGEPGQLEWLHNDKECKEYLNKWFKYVFPVCKTTEWGPRTIWKCLNDFGEFTQIYENNKTKCFISENLIFKKYKISNLHSFDNEVKYLKRLEKYEISPQVIDYNESELYLSGINGTNVFNVLSKFPELVNQDLFKNALFEIYYVLENNNIKHQDINLENIVMTQTGELMIVDFEYASDLDGDRKNKLVFDVNNLSMCKEVLKKLNMKIEFMK